MKKFLFILFCVISFVLHRESLSALTVGPTVLDFELDPGHVQDLGVTLYNESDTPVTVHPTLFQVEGTDKHGFPFFGRMKLEADVAHMVSFPSGMTHFLAARERKEVTVRVDAREMTPGGYYAVLSWGSADIGGSVTLSGQPATNIAISVRGGVERAAHIIRFAPVGSGLVMRGKPLVFEAEIENTGGIHIIPTGTATIRNAFGMTVARIPVAAARILPKTTRVTTISWEPLWALGSYRATLNLEATGVEILEFKLPFVAVSGFSLGVIGGSALLALVILFFRILKQ